MSIMNPNDEIFDMRRRVESMQRRLQTLHQLVVLDTTHTTPQLGVGLRSPLPLDSTNPVMGSTSSSVGAVANHPTTRKRQLVRSPTTSFSPQKEADSTNPSPTAPRDVAVVDMERAVAEKRSLIYRLHQRIDELSARHDQEREERAALEARLAEVRELRRVRDPTLQPARNNSEFTE